MKTCFLPITLWSWHKAEEPSTLSNGQFIQGTSQNKEIIKIFLKKNQRGLEGFGPIANSKLNWCVLYIFLSLCISFWINLHILNLRFKELSRKYMHLHMPRQIDLAIYSKRFSRQFPTRLWRMHIVSTPPSELATQFTNLGRNEGWVNLKLVTWT